MRPVFSILIPVHNREDCVRETIESVLGQTFTDYELIVVNDGSTDGTQAVLESYGDRIKVIRQAQSGPEVARNRAAVEAQGEYLALLDSDDLLTECALQTYDKVRRAFNSPPLILGSMDYFSDGNARNGKWDAAESVKVVNFPDFLAKDRTVGVSSSRIVIRKSTFQQCGGLRNSTPATFHLDDFNLLLRAGTSGPCMLVVEPITVLYRLHASNSIRNVEAMIRGVLAVITAERNREYPGGTTRRFARYATIGGPLQLWCRNALKQKRLDLAVRLLKSGWPMLGAAILRKMRVLLGRRQQTVLVPN
ncbi:MAG TPA: glycosyltransferase [Verrucomicrobiae bacterium]|nr:glycosyltransferase [Verrucomicrobiae bacterium]